jgi:nitrile hydratase accessory protein
MVESLDLEGVASPPRDNGELVFDAPWQGRAFAMVVALHETGRIPWEEFRESLISNLAEQADAGPESYWDAWLRAAESVLVTRQLVGSDERQSRLAAYAARPAGHDHDHDHDHDHEHDHSARTGGTRRDAVA